MAIILMFIFKMIYKRVSQITTRFPGVDADKCNGARIHNRGYKRKEYWINELQNNPLLLKKKNGHF